MIRLAKRGAADAERKISYCERAHRILLKRRDKSMDLDELARAIEREIEREYKYQVENPAKGTPHFVRIRNTLYKQIAEVGGWRGALSRTLGPMNRWMISAIVGKDKPPIRLRRTYQQALELAAEAGYSIDDVIIKGLEALDDEIKHKLTEKFRAKLDALTKPTS
jgi:hypothetical protein